MGADSARKMSEDRLRRIHIRRSFTCDQANRACKGGPFEQGASGRGHGSARGAASWPKGTRHAITTAEGAGRAGPGRSRTRHRAPPALARLASRPRDLRRLGRQARCGPASMAGAPSPARAGPSDSDHRSREVRAGSCARRVVVRLATNGGLEVERQRASGHASPPGEASSLPGGASSQPAAAVAHSPA